MAYKNKADQAANARKHYERNKEVMKIRARLNKQQTILVTKAYVDAIKSGPCTDCGQIFHPVAMDFDHVTGEKDREISRMVRAGCTLPRIKQEIEKCELVCSNCHRVRTHMRSKSGD